MIVLSAYHKKISFARRNGAQHVYVALNFSAETRTVKLPHPGRVLCCTHPIDYPEVSENTLVLRPYEGALIECREHPLDIAA